MIINILSEMDSFKRKSKSKFSKPLLTSCFKPYKVWTLIPGGGNK